MTAFISSSGLTGIRGFEVRVEVDASAGLPAFEIVGLPDAAIKESKERVRAAMRNSETQFPMKRIIVNLSPADVPKNGPIYDLPILIGLLIASGQLKANLDNACVLGQLSLSGEVLPVHGALPMVRQAVKNGKTAVFLPEDNIKEVAHIQNITIYPVKSVPQMLRHLNHEAGIDPITPIPFQAKRNHYSVDFSEVMGQPLARRALEIAAAGGHNLLMIGPPGSGKSMLAKRFPTILPDMDDNEAEECTEIYSVAQKLPDYALVTERPFRAPHHTASVAALCGGGKNPTPGEISLAHNGVLFLDEFPEFPPKIIESLRQPLEDGCITVSRAAGSITYPANITLLAAMNPCPCGYLGHPTKVCRCSEAAIHRYLKRISGPILDRIDLHIDVPAVEFEQLSSKTAAESSETIRARVNAARAIQQKRYQGLPFSKNADLTPAAIKEFCRIDDACNAILQYKFENSTLSARAYSRILKVARTIADLEGSEEIALPHLTEALQLRSLDKKYYL